MRTDLESRLRNRLTDDGYLFPDYGEYCFANVADTVQSVLGVGGERSLPPDVFPDPSASYDRVLLVLVDGFGLAHWKRHRSHPVVERLEERARVTPLTSLYPSETAAALTTFHTARLPVSHGVLGWDVYDPAADATCEAFTTEVTAGDETVDRDLEDVFEGDPIYPALERAGIDCRHVVPFPETYTGATCHTYGPEPTLEGFVPVLREAFAAADDPAYLYAYLPQIDSVAHEHGSTSDEYGEVVDRVFQTIEEALSALDSDEAGDTLVLLTADHGHVDTRAERNVDLERFDTVMESLQRHETGDPVRYAGSPRNLHLYLRPGTVDRVRTLLERELDAQIFTREAALECELFGPEPKSEPFSRRLGDLVVVHRDSLVWYGSDRTKLEFVGMHGGLHPDEMLVPFAAAELEQLV
ncbi:alkaline phosphatase family protein [Natrarchaeobaculum aegyptiacum]|uniref:Nucleotide pyrophosphatase n=1 Tax=Natrarchaeobaculum aegyptiacum TaxID=745377 RepID=A0A2Z2I0G7_9EURY|nr:nucleotide pyrophosphatase/phosphodiesterase family protein [Natrarchaeobaculum aegyptiacum]ARS91917.1 nucleotide pyrophosphatase [Natrarchaeobaculum aegyptiacum]